VYIVSEYLYNQPPSTTQAQGVIHTIKTTCLTVLKLLKKMHDAGISWGPTLRPDNFIGAKITDICLDTEFFSTLTANSSFESGADLAGDIYYLGLFLKVLLTGSPELSSKSGEQTLG
jgi:hypothetical protein